MLAITNLQNETEPLTDYKELNIEEEIFNADTGNMTLSFIALNSDKNKHAYPLLEEESIVEHEGHEYRVKGLSETRFRKNITAPHVFFDLVDERKYDIYGGTRSLSELASWVLQGTGFTHEIRGSFSRQFLPNFGNDNIIKLLKTMCGSFECEIEIAPNKHLIFHNQIGKDDDFQFRYKHNIKALSKKVNTTNLKTVIKGYGANNLVVTYESPNKSVFGERHAEPIKDEEYTVATDLTERIKRELNDVPEVSIEISEIDLGEEKGLGDKVWLIYEPLGIEFQTRIISRKLYPVTPNKNTVTLGTYYKKFTDLLTQANIKIDENNKQVQSRIDQTNDRITLEVEEIDGALATFEITVGQIQSTVTEEVERLDGDIESARSQITQTASAIRSEVSQDVQRLDGRIDSSNSSITQLATSIESRVTDSEARSIFRQEADSFTFDANQINFYGHVFGQGAVFTGELRGGSITSDTDINVTRNVVIGNILRLGTTGRKTIDFGYSNNIEVDLSGITINSNSGNLRLRSGTGVRVETDFNVTGSKNASVPTSEGMVNVSAYETAEYYFGDIGRDKVKNGECFIEIEALFKETVNTEIDYEVFLTAYGEGSIYVAEMNADGFTVKGDDIPFAYEIKAKRRGYEDVRLEASEVIEDVQDAS